eukprot:349932-Chlamydomonas_euryale.AAC.3
MEGHNQQLRFPASPFPTNSIPQQGLKTASKVQSLNFRARELDEQQAGEKAGGKGLTSKRRAAGHSEEQTKTANRKTKTANRKTKTAHRKTKTAYRKTKTANRNTKTANRNTKTANRKTKTANIKTKTANRKGCHDPRGIVARGIVARGIVARGIVARGMEARGMEARGMEARGMEARGILARGIIAKGIMKHETFFSARVGVRLRVDVDKLVLCARQAGVVRTTTALRRASRLMQEWAGQRPPEPSRAVEWQPTRAGEWQPARAGEWQCRLVSNNEGESARLSSATRRAEWTHRSAMRHQCIAAPVHCGTSARAAPV